MKRTASAQWRGDLKSGGGTVSTASKVLSGSSYSFHSRFEEGQGTNPEELLAAAHAGCFSMALSAQLGNDNLKPERIETTATVTLDKQDAGFAITTVHLDVTASIPGASEETFTKSAEAAKAGCPVSKLLNAKITMNARLVSERAA